MVVTQMGEDDQGHVVGWVSILRSLSLDANARAGERVVLRRRKKRIGTWRE
jgi:hypothetical protein